MSGLFNTPGNDSRKAVLNGKTENAPGTFSYYPPLHTITKGEHHYPIEIIELSKLKDEITGTRHKFITDRLRGIPDKKKRDKYKAANFYSVTPNGTFHFRDTSQLIKPSGYFIADFDDITDISVARQKLINDVEIKPVLLFVSPSQNGIKAFYKIDIGLIDYEAGSNKMQKLFYSFNTYLSLSYTDVLTADAKGNFICASGKDIPRLCFVCHDPEAYYNPDESSGIDESFYNKYYKPHGKKEKTKIVSPRTTIDDLAARHLTNDNHHPELLKFIAACNTCGHNSQTVLQYIDANVKISPESAHSDREKLIKEISDIYNRYPASSPDTIFITVLSFAYNIFKFNYSKEAKDFVLSGLYYEGVRQILHNAGFWKRYDTDDNSIYIKQTGQVIEEVSPERMRDLILRYVENINDPIQFTYQNKTYTIESHSAREFFLKNSNNLFNATWLEHLQIHTAQILKDTDKESYIITPTTLITITKDSIDQSELSDLKDVCVWKDQQIKREFTYIHTKWSDCKFGMFLNNVTAGHPENLQSLQCVIGYLLHNYSRQSEGQAVLFYDSAITDIKTPMGGTGKGLIANALKQVRDVTKIDGKHLDGGNRFKLERISMSTQIAWFDDVKNDFDFSMLHTNLTDGWTIERKFLPQFFIDPKDSPKVLICSNSIIKGSGTTNKRRQFIFELGDYYSSKIKTGIEKPIEAEHGGLFFNDDWSGDEWGRFLSLMCECVRGYLKDGLLHQKAGNVELNRFRQGTNDDFVNWCNDQLFMPGKEHERATKVLFTDFVTAYYGDNYKFSQRTFTAWLKNFAEFKGWRYDSRKTDGEIKFWFVQR